MSEMRRQQKVNAGYASALALMAAATRARLGLAPGQNAPPTGDGRRVKGPIELGMERASRVRARARKAAGHFINVASPFPRRVSWYGCENASKAARRAAGVKGRKASKRFYQQFKRAAAI